MLVEDGWIQHGQWMNDGEITGDGMKVSHRDQQQVSDLCFDKWGFERLVMEKR